MSLHSIKVKRTDGLLTHSCSASRSGVITLMLPCVVAWVLLSSTGFAARAGGCRSTAWHERLVAHSAAASASCRRRRRRRHARVKQLCWSRRCCALLFRELVADVPEAGRQLLVIGRPRCLARPVVLDELARNLATLGLITASPLCLAMPLQDHWSASQASSLHYTLTMALPGQLPEARAWP